MFIQEACRCTGLTKKAILYYTAQGLASPIVLDNGYRDYPKQEVQRLYQVGILRKLDLSIDEIKTVLTAQDAQDYQIEQTKDVNAAWQAIAVRKELAFQQNAMKKAVLEKLSSGQPYTAIEAELELIEQYKTITEKLLEAFPGYYGRFICLHFARFLDTPIETADQQSAYEIILSFLDHLPPLDLPQELKAYLQDQTAHLGTAQISTMLEQTKHSIAHSTQWIADNQLFLEEYLAYRQSEEYKASPAYQLEKCIKAFQHTSGYYEVLIPAIRRLSNSYAAYLDQIELANEKLLALYPEAANLG